MTDTNTPSDPQKVVTADKPRKKREVSAAHKEVLAKGREESAAIRKYLDALESHSPQRGRPVDPGKVKARLEKIGVEIEEADPLTRINLTQERLDLLEKLSRVSSPDTSIDELAENFVKFGKGYSERKGISYKAWREVGVPADVLKRAGITRAAT